MEKEDFAGIERSDERCAGCGRAFEGPGETQGGGCPPANEVARFAALFAEAGAFRRRDYCAPCFERLPERPVSFWRRAARKGKKREDEKEKRAARRRGLDALVELFERLSAPEEDAASGEGGAPPSAEEKEKLRYLLALALVRKRRLELVELAREGGADCLVLRASGQAELVTVAAPALSEADLSRLARELEQEIGC